MGKSSGPLIRNFDNLFNDHSYMKLRVVKDEFGGESVNTVAVSKPSVYWALFKIFLLLLSFSF